MSVGFLGSSEWEDGHARRSDAIEILVPGPDGAVSAVYRTDEGRHRKAYVCAPMVAVIPPGVECEVRNRRPADTLVMRIAAKFFEAQLDARPAEGRSDRLAARYATLDPLISSLARELHDGLAQGRTPGEAYLNAVAEVIAVHLARRYLDVDAARAAAGLAEHKLRNVQAFLREHIGRTLHVKDLAAVVHMSPFHFARMFKRSTGQTPHLYIVMQRVEVAKELLRTSDEPLIEVAVQAGFRTQGHFTGVFHRYTGLTPHVFRARSLALNGA